jgi:hypothetical protein
MQPIADQCYQPEWIQAKRTELGGVDPLLLEKAIRALSLVGALAARNIPFIFKGGSSLLIKLDRLRRVSIDADIIWLEKPDKLLPVLEEISKEAPFIGFAEDDRGGHRLPARKHFKFFFRSLDAKHQTPYVLLDVLLEGNVYPNTEPVPLRAPFIATTREVPVLTPTIEGLLGDKLTAFAPNTVGVPCDDYYSLQVIKQVFDIDDLFNVAKHLDEVSAAYHAVFEAEKGYRHGKWQAADALQDTITTGFLLSQIGLKGETVNATTQLLEKGRKQIASHLIGTNYGRQHAQISAAKAACIAAYIQSAKPLASLDAIRYSPDKLAQLPGKPMTAPYEILNRLTVNAEALWYWHQAQQAR